MTILDALLDTVDEEVRHILGEISADRAYSTRLQMFPDCRDPEHPGCQLCEPLTTEEDSDEIN